MACGSSRTSANGQWRNSSVENDTVQSPHTRKGLRFTPVDNLNPSLSYVDWAICVLVVEKRGKVPFERGQSQYTEVYLQDVETHSQIRAVAFDEDATKFDCSLQKGQVYIISGGTITLPRKGKETKHRFEMRLHGSTTVEPHQDGPVYVKDDTEDLVETKTRATAGFKDSLEAALARGSVEVEIVKCVTLGPPEAGKTQLKLALVGKVDDSIESTAMSTKAEVALQRYISGETSWEPLTRERLLNCLHTTVERRDFIESTSATTSTSAKTSVSTSSSVVEVPNSPEPEAAGGSKAEKKEALLKQFSAIRISVEEGLKEANSADVKGLQKMCMIHLIDSGGQPAFFDIHPVIATSRAVYFVVYNMEEGLEAKPKITYRKGDFLTKELPNEKQSNLDMIKDSLLILQNCKHKFAKIDGELHRYFGESISQSADAVPVLVIGTRKKVESVAFEGEKLAVGCSHLPTWSEVLDCTETGTKLFPVDSKDQFCKGLQSVREIIHKAECIYRLPLPISWVLCQLIFWSANENLHVLTYADLQDLCLQETLVANDAEFLAMVRTFHLLGIFSFPYFDQEHTLGDQWKPDSHPVFTNPDVLYQQVTKILEVAFRYLEKTEMNPQAKKSLKKLQSNGQLSEGTLHHLEIPDHLGSYTGFHSYLLERLVHWGLAARLPSKVSAVSARDESEPVLECFVPSVLPAYDQKSFKVPPGCPIPCLAFTFKVNDERPFYHVPQGIFPHLVVNILSADRQYHIQDNLDSYKCLFRDAATFHIKHSSSSMEHSYSVIVTNDIDHISISIYPSHAKMAKSDSDCCQIINDFQSAMEDAYERIYGARHPVTLACTCPCDRIDKDHLAAIVLVRACNPTHYNQECLSIECPNWEQGCPEDIAAILYPATNEASVSSQKRPPTHDHEESPPAKRTGSDEETAPEGGYVAPVYNSLHIPSLHSTTCPPPPPLGGTTTAVLLPATTGLTSTLAHPADIIRALRHQVDANWRHFGTFLYVEPALLDIIEMNNSKSVTSCMLDLVSKWMTCYTGTGDHPRTWQTVVEAVRESGCGQLAVELAEKHGVTLTQ